MFAVCTALMIYFSAIHFRNNHSSFFPIAGPMYCTEIYPYYTLYTEVFIGKHRDKNGQQAVGSQKDGS